MFYNLSLISLKNSKLPEELSLINFFYNFISLIFIIMFNNYKYKA